MDGLLTCQLSGYFIVSTICSDFRNVKAFTTILNKS